MGEFQKLAARIIDEHFPERATSGFGTRGGRLTTMEEAMSTPFEKRALGEAGFENSAPDRLQKTNDMIAEFLRKGLDKIQKGRDVSDSMASDWAEENGRKAMELGSMRAVKEHIAAETVAAGTALGKANGLALTEVEDIPRQVARAKDMLRRAEYQATPEAQAHRAEEERVNALIAQELEDNPRRQGMSTREQDKCKRLALKSIAAGIGAHEPPKRSDRYFTPTDAA